MKACFASTPILLPATETDFAKWAVVACDQYTSQPEYWKEVEALVADAPSTLHIIFPEVYLEEGEKRIAKIQQRMKEYLEQGILTEQVQDGFVLVERELQSGKRLGLVGALDLEAYDFKPGTNALVRATEGTIEERIPPRVKIRQGALVESPHVMVLMDDPKQTLIEALYEKKDRFSLLYDTQLMQKGGAIKGYAIQGEEAQRVNAQLLSMQQESGEFFLAVGDGNHSLATAKTIWNEMKKSLSLEEQISHPARYALVELVNIHSKAMVFEPIHRVLFQVDTKEVQQSFAQYLEEQDFQIEITDKKEADYLFLEKDGCLGWKLLDTKGRLAVDILQSFLDRYLAAHKEASIDYVHGEEAVFQLAQLEQQLGIVLRCLDKEKLFPAIVAGGVLPRKTFSMGEAFEKRYYMECRRL